VTARWGTVGKQRKESIMSDPTEPSAEDGDNVDRALGELFGVLKGALGDLQEANELTAAIEHLVDAKIRAALRPRIHPI
jgi:hypothetical protein